MFSLLHVCIYSFFLCIDFGPFRICSVLNEFALVLRNATIQLRDETLLDVDKHSGVVFLARAIVDDDLEMRHKHFNVSVSDGMFTAYTKLAVGIVASTARRSLPQFDQAFRQMLAKTG
ncbi:hypothetical protein Tcan_00352, partial [Toxocara canis]